MSTFFDTAINDRFLNSLTGGGDYVIRSQHDLSNQQDMAFSDASAFLAESASDICRGAIGEYYLNKTLWNGIGTSNSFDIAILFRKQTPQTYSDPLAFIVVELGECRRYPEVWTVNLICGKIAGIGATMMGLYLFTIFYNDSIHQDNKFGLLELANAYLNVGGLASYSKLGYNIDEELYSRTRLEKKGRMTKRFSDNCFGDRSNLPMRTQIIDEAYKNRIIQILNNPSSGYDKPPICKIIGRRDDYSDQLVKGVLQVYLGLCKNLILFLKYKKPIEDQELADSSKINFQWFKTFVLHKVENPALPEDERIQQEIVTPLEAYVSSNATFDPNTIPGFRDFFAGDNFKHAIKGPIIKGIEDIQKNISAMTATTHVSGKRKAETELNQHSRKEEKAERKQKEKTKEIINFALRRPTRSMLSIPGNIFGMSKVHGGKYKKTYRKKRSNKKTRKHFK